MTAYVAGMPMTAIAMPPRAGPRIAPAWLTLLRYETPADGLLARDDLCLEGGQGRPLEAARDAGHEDDGEDPERASRRRRATARRGRSRRGRATALVDDDDRAPVAAVGDVAAEQHERQGRDRLDQAEPAQGQRVARQLVGLEGDDGRERADREGVVERAPRSARNSGRANRERSGGSGTAGSYGTLGKPEAGRLAAPPGGRPRDASRRPSPSPACSGGGSGTGSGTCRRWSNVKVTDWPGLMTIGRARQPAVEERDRVAEVVVVRPGHGRACRDDDRRRGEPVRRRQVDGRRRHRRCGGARRPCSRRGGARARAAAAMTAAARRAGLAAVTRAPRPRHRARTVRVAATKTQAEGEQVQDLADRVGEQEHGPVEVIGHVADLGEGEQRERPAERRRAGPERPPREVAARGEQDDVDVRNPIGGIWLTKSPNGTRISPFRPVDPARVADPVGDDADEAQDHADEDDEMGRVLPEREPGRRLGGRERVLRQVEDQAEGDRCGTGLGEAGDSTGGGSGGLGAGSHGASRCLYR